MSNDAATTELATPRGSRFHFSLKTAFVVVTLVALWLGYQQVEKRHTFERHRRANELAKQLQAIKFAVQTNLATPPLETTIIAPNSPSADWFYAGPDERQLSLDQNAQWIYAGRSAQAVVRLELTLDASKALDVTTTWGLRKRLLRHYETNLAEQGLSRVSGRDGVSDANSVELWSIWMSKKQNPSATVYIRVRADEDSNQASAQVVMTAQVSPP